jgi:hypothetical protein
MKRRTVLLICVLVVLTLISVSIALAIWVNEACQNSSCSSTGGLPPIVVTSGTLFINGTFYFTLTNYVATPNSITSVTISTYPSVGGANATTTPTTMEYGSCIGNFASVERYSATVESCMVTGLNLTFTGQGVQFTINLKIGKPLSGSVFVSNSTLINPF